LTLATFLHSRDLATTKPTTLTMDIFHKVALDFFLKRMLNLIMDYICFKFCLRILFWLFPPFLFIGFGVSLSAWMAFWSLLKEKVTINSEDMAVVQAVIYESSVKNLGILLLCVASENLFGYMLTFSCTFCHSMFENARCCEKHLHKMMLLNVIGSLSVITYALCDFRQGPNYTQLLPLII